MGLVHSQSFVTVTSVQFQTMLIPRTLSSHSPTPAPAPANHRSAVLDVAHEQCLGSAGGGGAAAAGGSGLCPWGLTDRGDGRFQGAGLV